MNAKRDPGGRFAPKKSQEDVEAERAIDWFRRLIERTAEIDPDALVAIMVFGVDIEPVREKFMQVLLGVKDEPAAPAPPQPAPRPVRPPPSIKAPEDEPLGEDEIEIDLGEDR